LQFCVCQYQSIAILCLPIPKYCNTPSWLFFACKSSFLPCFITLLSI
jgi:hypothetical protein